MAFLSTGSLIRITLASQSNLPSKDDQVTKGRFEAEFLVEELSEGSFVFRNPVRPYEYLKISQVCPHSSCHPAGPFRSHHFDLL
jgi:hypothetical protein